MSQIATALESRATASICPSPGENVMRFGAPGMGKETSRLPSLAWLSRRMLSSEAVANRVCHREERGCNDEPSFT